MDDHFKTMLSKFVGNYHCLWLFNEFDKKTFGTKMLIMNPMIKDCNYDQAFKLDCYLPEDITVEQLERKIKTIKLLGSI
jgi:hypothetical protein